MEAVKKLFNGAIMENSTKIFIAMAVGLVIGLVFGACLRVSLIDFNFLSEIIWGIIIIITTAILITLDMVIDKTSRHYLRVIIFLFVAVIVFFLAVVFGFWLGTIIIPLGGVSYQLSFLGSFFIFPPRLKSFLFF